MSEQGKPPLHVDIKTGPHGRFTHIEIDGVHLKGASAFTLSADCRGATTMTVTFPAVEAVVDATIETTAFEAETRTYIAPKDSDDLDDVA